MAGYTIADPLLLKMGLVRDEEGRNWPVKALPENVVVKKLTIDAGDDCDLAIPGLTVQDLTLQLDGLRRFPERLIVLREMGISGIAGHHAP